MNVKLNKEQRDYPWVGKCTNDNNTSIVLFLDTNEAILLDSDTPSECDLLGVVDSDWLESDFEPCSVTLSSL